MAPKDRIKFVICTGVICTNGAANDEPGQSNIAARRDPMDPRLLTLARIIARAAVGEHLERSANDNAIDAAIDVANDNEPSEPDRD